MTGQRSHSTLANYTALKEELSQSLRDLLNLAKRRRSLHTRAGLMELVGKLDQERFNLVVLGQFKRGKTTLINALLGRPLLPVGVLPLTSIVTVIRYGEDLRIEVLFHNGDKKRIPLEELPNYVTEKGNPENHKGVTRVEIYYNAPFLREGMNLIDTPGIGSTYQHNTEVTYNYLPHVDAAIFLVGVDPPISQAEYDFLVNIKKYVEKIFFLLNKIDYVGESERREALEFTQHVLEEKLGIQEIKIFPISAKLAFEGKLSNAPETLNRSLLSPFEKALEEFLIKEKGKFILRSALNNALKLLGDEEMALKLEMKARRTPLADLQEKIARLNAQIEMLNQERQDAAYLLKGERARLMTSVEEDLHTFLEAQVPQATRKMEAHYKQHARESKRALANEMDRFLREEIERIFNDWRLDEEEKIGKEFERVSARFINQTNRMIESIKQLCSNVFDLGIEHFSVMETLTAESRLYYKTEELFGWGIDKAPFLLPKVLFRKLILSEMRERCREEMERNSGRVKYDFVQRIEQSMDRFASALDQKMDATLEGIQGAIARALEEKQKGQQEVQWMETTLQEQLNSVQRMKSNLLSIKGQTETMHQG